MTTGLKVRATFLSNQVRHMAVSMKPYLLQGSQPSMCCKIPVALPAALFSLKEHRELEVFSVAPSQHPVTLAVKINSFSC